MLWPFRRSPVGPCNPCPLAPLPSAFVPKGDIVASEKDKASDVERLVVYRVM
jgi:hypothetical protein